MSQRRTQSKVMALIKCNECGQMLSDKAKTCPNCGAPVEYAETQCIESQAMPNGSILKIVRMGRYPLGKMQMEVKANGQTIGSYPFKLDADVEVPVSSDMEIIIKDPFGIPTPIKLSLETNANYTCKVSGYNSYELYGNNGILLKQEKFGQAMLLLTSFIPIIGFIYYFVKRKECPTAARGALIGGLCGLAFNLFMMIVR